MSPFNANHLHLSDKLDLFLCDLEMFVFGVCNISQSYLNIDTPIL